MKILLVIGSGMLLLFWSCGNQPVAEQSTPEDIVKRGEYLVNLGGCNDCHSPKKFTEMGPVPDESRLMSGHPADATLPKANPAMIGPGKWVLMNDQLTAFVGPWGISFGANLTPDKETGIGVWTEEIFIQALRTGKHMGAGRPILPPMPWYAFAKVTDQDLKAMFAYLNSLPPVKNRVPDPIPISDLMQK